MRCTVLRKSLTFYCPFVEMVWESSGLDCKVGARHFRSQEWVEYIMATLNIDRLGEFVAILVKYWNA